MFSYATFMLGFFEHFERFLRLERFGTKSEMMRARAVYMMGLAFIATQGINQYAMTYSYGAFTFDHMISLIASALVVLCILAVRYNGRFQIFALIYSVLIIGGVLSSALNQNTGINSSLIPFLVLGVVVNGFICGWRATLTFGGATLALVWGLWWVSTNYDYTPVFDVEKFADRNFQRAVQASLAVILISMVAGFFSKNMHEAFDDLEAGILAAQDSDRAKTNFLATMSHELCTPMNGIIGMTDILEDTNLDADQAEITSVIRQSGHDLQSIITNVLLFSQLDAGRISLDDTAFDIRQAVNISTAKYAAAMEEKGLTLEIFVAESLPTELIGDQLRTLQLIDALIDNAVKFTDAGTIKVALHGGADPSGNAALLLAVSDTGIGIAEEDQSQIFERFMQKDGSIKRRFGGTGLGLTVARGLAELMGGALNVKSKPGVGSTFTARLAYKAPITDPHIMPLAAE